MKSRPIIRVVGLFTVSPLDMVMGFQVPGPEECLKAMEPMDPLPETLWCAFDPAVDFDTVPAPQRPKTDYRARFNT